MHHAIAPKLAKACNIHIPLTSYKATTYIAYLRMTPQYPWLIVAFYTS